LWGFQEKSLSGIKNIALMSPERGKLWISDMGEKKYDECPRPYDGNLRNFSSRERWKYLNSWM